MSALEYMIGRQAQAIVWAQWKSLLNYRNKGYGRFPLIVIVGMLWYGLWATLAFAVFKLLSVPPEDWLVTEGGATGLLLIFGYWQLVPVMMVSSGLSLDLNRLVVYPIPRSKLFGIEVLLRVTTCAEMLLIVGGAAAGLMLNPAVPWWGPLALLPFVAMNLYLSVGVRDLLVRLLSRKGLREFMVFCLVLLAALPQLLLSTGVSSRLKPYLSPLLGVVTPWGATSRLMFGQFHIEALIPLALWTAVLWKFGRYHFDAGLRFDAAAARATNESNRRFNLLDAFLRLPSAVLPDPIAALVEKEIRVLSRAPRFRLLFLMGFSFGLILWLPLALGSDSESVVKQNYLALVSVYALMLLGEVCFWNSLGMDRSAAQSYFVLPVKMSQVLIAKNIAAAFFIVLEVFFITFFSVILRMPITLAHITEALSVTLITTIFLLAIGNVLSVRYPRAIDPAQSWRSGAMGRVQAYLLIVYPLTGAPVMLAYGARYAFDSEVAFYGVLFLDLLIGLMIYAIGMESAVNAAMENKEDLAIALSSGHGPVGG